MNERGVWSSGEGEASGVQLIYALKTTAPWAQEPPLILLGSFSELEVSGGVLNRATGNAICFASIPHLSNHTEGKLRQISAQSARFIVRFMQTMKRD